ncbi:MAG: hydrogenase maturation nickel metallochaperone HypA [Proteobacteria bacterium]|nr:hydrogenase maturation nickel metallochaperone HypA [Pseudomonadota bacterium]
MHELSIASSLIETAANHVPEGNTLQGVHITVGDLSGICAESLDFCFSIVAREKGHPSARLIITPIPARFHCRMCLKDYEAASVYHTCPFCESLERDILEGDRFTIDAIDVEEINHV